MATPVGKQTDDIDNTVVFTWETLANGEVGTAVYTGNLTEMSAQALGDATSIAIHGSNDGTNFAALGTAVVLTIASSKTPVVSLLQFPRYVRPVATGGADTDVILIGKRKR